MDYSNYTVFEIIKYKIEFMECLEYSLTHKNITDEQLIDQITYLNTQFKTGLYKEIVSSLFTSYNYLNEPLKRFLKKYKSKKITNVANSKKAIKLIKFNENIIDCYETFNYILSSFFTQEEILKKLDPRITELNKISDNHFIYFLFFNTYTMYIECLTNNLAYKEKDLNRLIKILNYCNNNKTFDTYIEVLKKENIEDLYKETEKISKECMQLENTQYTKLNDFLNYIKEQTRN